MTGSQPHPPANNTRIAVRNSAFSLLSLGCRLIGNMVVFIVIARIPGIGTEAFGKLTYAVALGSLVVMASQFGLVPLIIRDIAANPSLLKSRSRAALSLRILLTILGMTATIAYVRIIGMDSEGRTVCYIMITALFVGSFSSDFQALFQSQEKMHLELAGIVAENTFLLAMATISFFLRPTIVQVAWGFLAAKCVSVFLNYLVCGKFLVWVIPRFDPGQWKRMVLHASPFALAAIIATGVVQLDTVLLRELAGKGSVASVGLYQAAVRLFLIPMLLPEVVLKVFLPQFSRMHGRAGAGLVSDLGKVNNILLTLGTIIGLLTVFRGHDIILLIYGARYQEVGPILRLLGFSIMLRFGAAYNLYFTIRDRVWFRVGSALLALCAVVVFDIVLIPRFGAIGAAYASILSNVVYWIPYLAALYLAEGTIAMGWNIVRAGVAAFLYALVLYATSGINLLFALPVYLLLGAIALIVTLNAGDRIRLASQLGLRSA